MKVEDGRKPGSALMQAAEKSDSSFASRRTGHSSKDGEANCEPAQYRKKSLRELLTVRLQDSDNEHTIDELIFEKVRQYEKLEEIAVECINMRIGPIL